MNRKKIFLASAIIITVIFAGWYCYHAYFRLLLIRWTIGTDLPDWFLAWLWGWK